MRSYLISSPSICLLVIPESFLVQGNNFSGEVPSEYSNWGSIGRSNGKIIVSLLCTTAELTLLESNLFPSSHYFSSIPY